MQTVAALGREVARALGTLRPALESPAAFQGVALRLGWRLDTIPQPIRDLATSFVALEHALEPMLGDDPSAEQIATLLEAVKAAADAIAGLSGQSFDPVLAAAGFATELPARLVEYALVEYLLTYHPTLLFAARALGVVRQRYVPPSGIRPGFIRREIAWPDLARLVRDPVLLLENAYGWRTPEFDGRAFLRALGDLLGSIKLVASLEEMPTETAELVEEAGEHPDQPIRWRLDAPIYLRDEDDLSITAGVRTMVLPATGTHLPGIAVMPYAAGSFEERFPLDDHLAFTLRSSLDFEGGIAVRIRPNEPIDVLRGFETGTPSHATGMISGRIDYSDPDLQPTTVLGSATGSRVDVTRFGGVATLAVDATSPPELALEIELGGRFVLAGEGDGFLRRVLPRDGVAASFDLAVGLSTKRGIYFRGSGELAVTVPVHARIGPLTLQSITVGITAGSTGVPIDVGVTVAATLGPFTAVVEDVGVRAALTFPSGGGNLGPLDIDVGFKPPRGIGLAIDAGGFSGGGFIDRDPTRPRYRGILALAFQRELAITGVGILDTALPDRPDAFSLLVAITARFRAIQLGLGFTLNGVGGMLGLHRTADLAALRAGLGDGTLGRILFPEDPIANAEQILADLDRVFPAREGRHLVAPIARIGWGTPTLITADVGLVLELPSPVRLALIGVVRSLLPDPNAPLLKLQASFLGTLDFDKRQLAFDARLFDSRLLSFTLDGDIAMRLVWGDHPNFVLSVGGFHPAYKPPPLDIPDLRRISLDLLGGGNPRLRAEMYLAVTSNTLQLGASVELYAGVSRFNIYGFLGFDALAQVNPLRFVASAKAKLAVRVGDDPFLSVSVELTLEGPTPWHATGSAKFKICWFLSFSVHFDVTWGSAAGASLDDVDVLPLVLAALQAPTAWRAASAPTSHALVEVRGAATSIDPGSTISIAQSLVPFGVSISRFGAVKPRDATKFEITSITDEDGDDIDTDPVTAEFAAAQFFDMSDAEKLGRPSFERYAAGVELTETRALVADHVVSRDVEYEEIIIDRVTPARRFGRQALRADLFDARLLGNAIHRSPLARRARVVAPPVEVAVETFTIATRAELRVAGRSGLTYAAAVDEMARLVAASPQLAGTLQIVADYEVAV